MTSVTTEIGSRRGWAGSRTRVCQRSTTGVRKSWVSFLLRNFRSKAEVL
jgi:hypothetical protein